MKENDKKRFMDAIGTLAEMHNKKLSTLLLKAYWGSLQKFEIEEIETAAGRLMETSRYFPKPVEIIEAITGGAQDINDVAMIQANNVIESVRTVGGYRSVEFDDPTTAAVVKLGWGGWQKLCDELKEADEKWFRIEFCKIYKAYKSQRIEHHGTLAGRIENTNDMLGYTVTPDVKRIESPGAEKRPKLLN